MAKDAVVNRVCPGGYVYLVPGRLAVRTPSPYYQPESEEIIVDIMPTGSEVVVFKNPTALLRLTGPAGCEFQLPNKDLPNHFEWSHPVTGDKTQVRAVFTKPTPTTLNRGNSLSYRFPISGRDGRDCTVEIVMSAEPVQVVADSCRWTVSGLGTDTTNLGAHPLDALP
ncbi:hypothetical protein [Nonomuraea candida]|uniref:hypothetical protein n=1 Tax=Nonomuraea candida TaxID=359159 RepID=UPI0005B7F9C5|nr:hypothetical protein [Nonomuraea candida]